MFSKMFMAAAMVASATAGESELFLVDQALEEYEMELAASTTGKENGTPAQKGAFVPYTSKLLPMDEKRKIAGCSIFTTQTGQSFTFAGFDKKNGVKIGNPMNLKYQSADGNNMLFQFSFCTTEFSLTEQAKKATKKKRILASESCKGKKESFGNLGLALKDAAHANPSDYNCKFTFDTPKVAATYYDQASKTYNGLKAEFLSDQACDTGKYNITFNMKCGDKPFDGNWIKQGNDVRCKRVFEATGQEACNTFNFGPLYKYMYVIGAFEVIAGLVICFAGIKVYDKLVFMFAFLATAGVIMGISFQFYSTTATPLIIGGVLAVIAGLAVGYLLKAFIIEHGVALLGLTCGGVLGIMVGAPIQSAIAKLVIMGVLAAVGAYVGYKYNEYIKVLGMAVIGAGMIIQGLGQYLGGFPALVVPADAEAAKSMVNTALIGYFVGFIVLSVAGYYSQKQMHVSNEKGVNAFDDE